MLASVAAAGAMVLSAFAPAAADEPLIISENESGVHGGLFYSLWSDTPGAVVMRNDPGVGYYAQWSMAGDFVVGEGWEIGKPRVVEYRARSFRTTGNSFLALHGWIRDPLVEYFVVESWGPFRPTPGEHLGTVSTQGGAYDIYRSRVVDGPSIEGDVTTYDQYWSVRTQPARIDWSMIWVGDHLGAWQEVGMELGTLDQQIMGVVGRRDADRFIPNGGSVYLEVVDSPGNLCGANGGGCGPCRATYEVTGSWPGGFVANVEVTARPGASVDAWNVSVELPEGAAVTSLWNGVSRSTGQNFVVANAPWNGTLDDSQSVTFGFQGVGDGAGAKVSCYTS